MFACINMGYSLESGNQSWYLPQLYFTLSIDVGIPLNLELANP